MKKSTFKMIRYLLIIVLFSINIVSQGQQNGYTLDGKIVGDNKQPVQGVSVSIDGVSGDPSITDENGSFELKVPSGDVWLIIQPVSGYQNKSIFLNNRSDITIQLTPNDLASGYEEVSVLLGTKKRRNIISSFSTYNPDNLHYYPYQTIDQYFQGSVSGMHVKGHSGMPGTATTSYLHGVKSMNTNNQPLYVIDGIPLESFGLLNSEINGYAYNPLTSIEPFDISDITILKDNFATALYGMKGSNGVIIIETLKPTELRTTIEFSARTGINFEPERHIPQMNSLQHKIFANEVLQTSGILEENFPELYPGLYTNKGDDQYHRFKHETNWQNEVFGNGLMNDAFLKVKGGDEIARYGLSVGYMNHDGIIKNTNYDRFNIRLVGTFNIFQWLRMYISTHLNINTSEMRESAIAQQSSPLLNSLVKPPMMTPYKYNNEGEQLSVLDDVSAFGISNPTAIVKNFDGNSTNYHSLNSIRLEGEISEQFKFNSLFGVNINTMSEKIFKPNYAMALYDGGIAYNISKNTKNFLFGVYNDNSISYIPDIGNLNNLRVDVGFKLNTNRYEEDLGIAKNSHENDEYKSLQSGTFYLKEIQGTTNRWNRLAIYTNINYILMDRYLINAAYNLENSSRLGENTDLFSIGDVPFGSFYSFGSGWRLSSENFMKDIFWLEELKLRASYTMSGNDDIGNLSALDYYRVDHYQETSAMIPGNITDGSLKHESYQNTNFGMDLALWANRFGLSVDYYNIKTSDMLVYEPQSFYIGFATVPTNNGELNSKGLEFSMFSRLINRNNFKWDINVNVTPWQMSEVTSIREGEIVTAFTGGEYISKEGNALLEFHGYEFEGVYSTTEEAEEANLENAKGFDFIAGDAKFKDISGPNGEPDGIIDDFDKTAIGFPIPDFFGGITNQFKYGRWSLNLNVQFVAGNEVFNYLRYQNEKMSDISNQSISALNRWQYEGHDTDIPRALWADPMGNSDFSSRWIEDGSYIRLKNLTLAYTIPEEFLVFNNLSVFLTGTNLFTYSEYLGYDPEFSYSLNTMEQGIDYGLMPVTRKFMVGVKVGL